MKNTRFRSALRLDLGKIAAQRSIFSRHCIHLCFEFSSQAVFADNFAPGDAGSSGKTSLRRRLHDLDLSCSKESDQVGTGALKLKSSAVLFRILTCFSQAKMCLKSSATCTLAAFTPAGSTHETPAQCV